MADYPKMYALLCGAISDALDLLTDHSTQAQRARFVLQQALFQAEELYLASPEETTQQT